MNCCHRALNIEKAERVPLLWAGGAASGPKSYRSVGREARHFVILDAGQKETKTMKLSNWKHYLTVSFLAVGIGLSATLREARAQAAPDLPSGVQDVIKLVKAGLSEDVVLAQIKSTGASYNFSADQLIYLKDQGVTQNEIKALMRTTGSASPANPTGTFPPAAPPAAPAAPSLPPAVSTTPAPYVPGSAIPAAPVAPAAPLAPLAPVAQTASLESFQTQLSAYGSWVEVPGYGLCWRPTVAASDPFWRPYCDQGHWVYTADGWFWQSDYPWGDIVFHYGRWHRGSVGWVWVPGYDWAPAWVCWRQAEGYCGWAPLPPGAVYRAGVGLWFNGHVAVDVDFGLRSDAFTFVAYDRFWEPNLRLFILPRERVGVVFARSVVRNGYRVEHGRFVVEGLGREHIAIVTHHEVRIVEPVYHRGPFVHGPAERRVIRDERRERH